LGGGPKQSGVVSKKKKKKKKKKKLKQKVTGKTWGGLILYGEEKQLESPQPGDKHKTRQKGGQPEKKTHW